MLAAQAEGPEFDPPALGNRNRRAPGPYWPTQSNKIHKFQVQLEILATINKVDHDREIHTTLTSSHHTHEHADTHTHAQ